MDKLRELQPWQIISIAVGVLIVFAVAAYFIVVTLTSVKPTVAPAQQQVPKDLGSKANQNTIGKLGYFEVPKDLPLTSQPLQTPDPNGPSTINPFRP